jgi:hypothetical protein
MVKIAIKKVKPMKIFWRIEKVTNAQFHYFKRQTIITVRIEMLTKAMA